MSKTYYDYAEVDWEQKYLDLDTGVRMAYYECGPKDGKTVLLIHGVTDGCVAWAQIAPVLEKAGCHCYIVEYRGNGMTDKPDMGPFGYTGELLAGDIIDFIETGSAGNPCCRTLLRVTDHTDTSCKDPAAVCGLRAYRYGGRLQE